MKRRRVQGAPSFPSGAKKGSAAYKEWARDYARARRAMLARAKPVDNSVSNWDSVTTALLVELAEYFKTPGMSVIEIPSGIWSSFDRLNRKSSYTASVYELDLLGRCRCGSDDLG